MKLEDMIPVAEKLDKVGYHIITEEIQELLKGEYGDTPGPINRELQRKGLKDKPPTKCRPADITPDAMDRLREELKGAAESEEGILTYALFPHIALDFFKNRKESLKGLQ